MHLTAMLDLQYVDFGVEGEPTAKTMNGRGGNKACFSKEEGRGCGSVEGRRVGDVVARLQPLGGDGTSRGRR
jgi:hypothetical protein